LRIAGAYVSRNVVKEIAAMATWNIEVDQNIHRHEILSVMKPPITGPFIRVKKVMVKGMGFRFTGCGADERNDRVPSKRLATLVRTPDIT
jgi:hypothetical protein